MMEKEGKIAGREGRVADEMKGRMNGIK